MRADVHGLSAELIGETSTQEAAHTLTQEHEGLRNVHFGRFAAHKSPLKKQKKSRRHDGRYVLVFQ